VSLSGSVDDLPLLEILQVVSFCQKTGHLTVRSSEGEAAVVFERGRVVSGYIWDVPALAPGQLPEGRRRDEALRRRIGSILERLVRLRTGEFAFNLTDEVPTRLGGRDLSGETLSSGINPEELMLDLARQLDEHRREAAATLEASFAAPPDDDEVVLEELPPEELALEEPEAPAPSDGPVVVLLDDEPDVRRVVGDRLAAGGFSILLVASASAARREMERLTSARTPFVLVADLSLPSEAGTSFRGGLEVVRAASALPSPPTVLLMTEALDGHLRARARRVGVSRFAFKPGLSKLDPLQYEADLRAFGDKLARDLLPRLAGRRPPAAGPAPAPAAAESPQADLLRSALEEIQRTPDPDLVAFLLMRTARAFFPRVLLFVVKDERLRGLSGFGPVDSGDSLDLLAREISVPLEPPSAFREAVTTGRAWMGPLPEDGPLRGLLDRIGAMGATTAAVVPLRAYHEAIAVLYGDDPEGVGLRPIGPLVEFVEQVARALDESLLARRTAAAAPC
jgi:CheY-like chemotaxis protein